VTGALRQQHSDALRPADQRHENRGRHYRAARRMRIAQEFGLIDAATGAAQAFEDPSAIR
jgi:hypothetical protein